MDDVTISEPAREPRFWALPGVPVPASATWLLADAAIREPMPLGGRVLALGSGTSVAGIAGARAHRMRLTVVSQSRRARADARLNGAINRVGVRTCRCLAPGEDDFDLILVAPDDLSSSRPPLMTEDAARRLLDGLVLAAAPRLRHHGVLLVMHSDVWDVGATITSLVHVGLSTEVLSRSEPWQPGRVSDAAIILRARRE